MGDLELSLYACPITLLSLGTCFTLSSFWCTGESTDGRGAALLIVPLEEGLNKIRSVEVKVRRG
jgi:hypothetical protein